MPFGPWGAPRRFLGCPPRGGVGAQPLGAALGPGRLCRWGSQGVAEVPTESPPLIGLSPSLLHSEGSNLTPAHHFQDFRFKTYAPVAFRYFRELFGIRPDDYLVRAVVSHLPPRDKFRETGICYLAVSVGQEFGCNSAGFFAQHCSRGGAGARASGGPAWGPVSLQAHVTGGTLLPAWRPGPPFLPCRPLPPSVSNRTVLSPLPLHRSCLHLRGGGSWGPAQHIPSSSGVVLVSQIRKIKT